VNRAYREAVRNGRRVLLVAALAMLASTNLLVASSVRTSGEAKQWIGTWATAPQASVRGPVQTFQNQTLRLIVHTSASGKKVRIKISNTFGSEPLIIGSAHIARRAAGADIDPTSDRNLMFDGRPSTTVPAGSMAVSDPVALNVPALSDLAISLFLPESTKAATSHILALQTNYVSPDAGDSTAAVNFPVAKTIASWPFLSGVEVMALPRGATIVALGSSLTDGDGSTKDANRRWPDVLAERLQKTGGPEAELGVLNEGIIGNRLLSDTQSPRQTGGPLAEVLEQLGPALGESGVRRFQRDVLDQPGVKYVILALGVNDILFPGSFIAATEGVTAQAVIAGNGQLIGLAHKKGIRAIGTTIPPFEHAIFRDPFFDRFYTPEKEKLRQEVNAWIRSSGKFDGVIDFDEAVRDPRHPTQLLPAYDSGDHLHVNDAGNVAQGNAILLALFQVR
jgi:lysophospholipase L1-like esterase